MICSDCKHVLKREYLKEPETAFCLLDHRAVGVRLMKCSCYEKVVVVFATHVTNATPEMKVEKIPNEAFGVLPIAKKRGRKPGWRKMP